MQKKQQGTRQETIQEKYVRKECSEKLNNCLCKKSTKDQVNKYASSNKDLGESISKKSSKELGKNVYEKNSKELGNNLREKGRNELGKDV